jgi:hypothetical protein
MVMKHRNTATEYDSTINTGFLLPCGSGLSEDLQVGQGDLGALPRDVVRASERLAADHDP